MGRTEVGKNLNIKKRKIGWFSAMLCRLFSYIRYGHVFDVED